MFNYLELDIENRKKILKYINEKDYKKANSSKAPPIAVLKKAFGKTELSRVDFAKMKNYVNEHCVYADDEIMKFYNFLIDKKLSNNIDFYSDLISVIDDNEYLSLIDNKKDLIESFRKPYEELDMPFDYDTLIKFLCVPSDDSLNELKEERINRKFKEYEEQIKEREDSYNELVKTYNEQIKQIRSLNNEVSKLTSDNNKYEKMLSIEKNVEKLSTLLPEDFVPKTYKEVYDKLNELEIELLNSDDINKCKKVLAAKYALLKIMN